MKVNEYDLRFFDNLNNGEAMLQLRVGLDDGTLVISCNQKTQENIGFDDKDFKRMSDGTKEALREKEDVINDVEDLISIYVQQISINVKEDNSSKLKNQLRVIINKDVFDTDTVKTLKRAVLGTFFSRFGLSEAEIGKAVG